MRYTVRQTQVVFLVLLLRWVPDVAAWSIIFQKSSGIPRPPATSQSDTLPDFQGVTRRHILGTTPLVPMLPSIAKAASPVDAGEAVRRSAANLPGYGPTDVFYPVDWKGLWTMRRELISDNTLVLNYTVRFLPSIQDSAVVADRGFNQVNLETSLRGKEDAVQSCTWSETNPNDLRMILADGSRKEIKVTKRASEMTEKTVSSSEFQRVSQEDARGIPAITARRVLTKWKMVNDNLIEGLELVYDMGGGGDPLSTTATSSSPKVLSKSRLRLERIQ